MKKEGEILEKWREAKVIWGGGCAAVSSVIITGICITVSFLRMLFQGGADGYRTCFFNTIYFKSVTNLKGTVSISMGLTGRYLPLIIFLIIIFVLIFGVFYMTKMLLIYRQKLLDERSEKGGI